MGNGEHVGYTNWGIDEPNNSSNEDFGIYQNNAGMMVIMVLFFNQLKYYYILEIASLTNSSGCDSTAILYLTIMRVTPALISRSIVKSIPGWQTLTLYLPILLHGL